jgi:hypothetical protein
MVGNPYLGIISGLPVHNLPQALVEQHGSLRTAPGELRASTARIRLIRCGRRSRLAQPRFNIRCEPHVPTAVEARPVIPPGGRSPRLAKKRKTEEVQLGLENPHTQVQRVRRPVCVRSLRLCNAQERRI